MNKEKILKKLKELSKNSKNQYNNSYDNYETRISYYRGQQDIIYRIKKYLEEEE